LSNQARNASNFFNSSITDGNGYAQNRMPNSKNTLGYDSFIMNIPNVDNTLFDENVSQTEINFKSSGDKSYLFFAALSIDSQDNNAVASIEAVKDIQPKSNFENNEVMADAFQAKMLVRNTNSKEMQVEQIPNLKMGYYEIANVFSDKYFAKKFMKDLKAAGQQADYFVNPINDLMYVYILKTDKIEEIERNAVASNQNYKGDTWVMSINQNQQSNLQGMLATEE